MQFVKRLDYIGMLYDAGGKMFVDRHIITCKSENTVYTCIFANNSYASGHFRRFYKNAKGNWLERTAHLSLNVIMRQQSRGRERSITRK